MNQDEKKAIKNVPPGLTRTVKIALLWQLIVGVIILGPPFLRTVINDKLAIGWDQYPNHFQEPSGWSGPGIAFVTFAVILIAIRVCFSIAKKISHRENPPSKRLTRTLFGLACAATLAFMAVSSIGSHSSTNPYVIGGWNDCMFIGLLVCQVETVLFAMYTIGLAIARSVAKPEQATS